MIGALINSARQLLPRLASIGNNNSSIVNTTAIFNPWSHNSSRTTVRYHFPRPSEVRRYRRQSWQARMATPNGRKIIMRRILKGKYALTH